MSDVLGKALWDYQNGRYTEDIKTFSSLDEEDVIPLPHLFRDFDAMPFLEQKALELCKGTILDIGCGAGSHALYLQGKGLSVTGLDASEGSVETCRARGLKKVVRSDIYSYNGTKFDTLLLLMNGIGIVGQLKDLDRFLMHLKSILRPNGQILLDSSDIIYMFDPDEDGDYFVHDNERYYGEVKFTMEYKEEKSKPFHWLYLDYTTLQRAAYRNNLSCELVSQGRHYDYLARLALK